MNKNDIVGFKVRKLHCTNYVADGVLSLSPPARFNYFFFQRLDVWRETPGKIDDDITVDGHVLFSLFVDCSFSGFNVWLCHVRSGMSEMVMVSFLKWCMRDLLMKILKIMWQNILFLLQKINIWNLLGRVGRQNITAKVHA